MKGKDMALRVAGVIFSLVAIIHFLRVLRRVPLAIGDIQVPQYLSIIGFALALLLAIWMFTASKKAR